MGVPELSGTQQLPGQSARRAGPVSTHEDALALLGVGASLKDDVERNTRLQDEPAAPAHQVYSGVLYDALSYKTLTPAQRRKAVESVLVVSALWGAIGFGDRVPAYRLSMGTALPDVGRLASFWKPQLTQPSPGASRTSCWWTAAPARTPRPGLRRGADRLRQRLFGVQGKAHRRQPLRQAHPRRTGPALAEPSRQGAGNPGTTTQGRARKGGQRSLTEGTARKPHALSIVLPN